MSVRSPDNRYSILPEKKRGSLFYHFRDSVAACLHGFYIYHKIYPCSLKDPELSILVEETSNVIVTITEYTCFSYFFYHSLHQIKNKKLVIFFSAFFILPVIIFFVRLLSGFPAQSIRHLSFTISSIEMILLLMPGLLYFIELFYYKPVEHLSQKPSFWIVSALTLYCILVIPFFLIADRFIYPNSAVLITGFTIHLISFCLLFLALVKAFSLNKKLTE